MQNVKQKKPNQNPNQDKNSGHNLYLRERNAINLGHASCVSGSRCSLSPSTLTELFQNLDLRELTWCKVFSCMCSQQWPLDVPLQIMGDKVVGRCRWSILRFYLCSNFLCLFDQFGITIYHMLLTPAVNELGVQCGQSWSKGLKLVPGQSQSRLRFSLEVWEFENRPGVSLCSGEHPWPLTAAAIDQLWGLTNFLDLHLHVGRTSPLAQSKPPAECMEDPLQSMV